MCIRKKSKEERGGGMTLKEKKRGRISLNIEYLYWATCKI